MAQEQKPLQQQKLVFCCYLVKKQRNWSLVWRRLLPSVQNRSRPLRVNAQRKNWKQRKIEKKERLRKNLSYYAPINVNPVGGGGECGQGAGIWCLRLSPCRAFDRVKRSRGRDIWLWPAEAWYQFRNGSKSVPRGFLKATLFEKGVKFSFVLIAIIR